MKDCKVVLQLAARIELMLNDEEDLRRKRKTGMLVFLFSRKESIVFFERKGTVNEKRIE